MEPAISVPDWLNAEFLQTALQNGLGISNDVTVTKFDVQSAAPKGEHFGSSLHRVIVNYRNGNNPHKTSHLIVKSLPTAEIMRQLLTDAKIFKRETEVYTVVLPAMYSLLEEATGPGVQHLTSKCFYCKSDILVFEDLKNLGFKMANRRSGLDLSHCKIALKGLARFHAMSIALHKKDPTYMSHFSEGLYIEARKPILDSYVEPGIKRLACVVEKWAGYERFGEKLRRVAETGVDRILDVVKPREDCLSVLNHGDFWVNNIMFRYSSNGDDIEGVSFVDFQTSRFTSPALDLQYFIYTSPSETVRFNHVDELLELYHVEFRNHLRVLGCDLVEFTFQQLKKEFENKAFFGLITVCNLLNLVLCDPKAALDIEHLTDNTSNQVEMTPVEKSYWDPLYRDQLQKLLVHFESKGLL